MAVPNITEADKARFLELIREGFDRPGAARRTNPEHTGRMFALLVSQNSIRYDHEFALAYDQAVIDRGPRFHRTRHKAWRQPRLNTMHGNRRSVYISDEEIEQFIDAVRNGIPLKTAADQIGTSLWQLNLLAENETEFAHAMAEARRIGYPIMQENLRAEAQRQAFNGDYRALRDLAMIHLPEYAPLAKNLKGDQPVVDWKALIREKMADLPPAVLDEMIRMIEQEQPEQKEIEAA
jgi:hypothetical protein